MINTDRLILEPLSANESAFLIELINTDGWKKYIGTRNIHTAEEASVYIKKYSEDKNTSILSVKLKETKLPVGIITILKRDYLKHKDIGFAFLPEYTRKGYAYEASSAVLKDLKKKNKNELIEAITVPENVSSISLLNKLGFEYDKEILVDKKTMCVYILDQQMSC
ncbi:MAG: GNAT family N-acetyltransferase [Ignavibacteriae bacterium]|nr:GNAT family N-acetyltransferase [Ignavibacteriota bacterium]